MTLAPLRRSSLCLLLLLPLAPATPATTERDAPAASKALIVSIDGLGPAQLEEAAVPHLRRLMARGTVALEAQAVDPPYTVPGHVSMITGVVPERHGVTWNAHIEGAYPQVPTLFALARRAGFTTALVAGKTKLVVLTEPGTLDWVHLGHEHYERDADVAEQAVTLIRRHRPDVLFVHLGDVDTVGHADGWGSPAQLGAVEEADRLVGRLVDALDDAALLAGTVVVVTADHGGHGRAHGPEVPESTLVPWIAAGPTIRSGVVLDRGPDGGVPITATFALVASLLGLDVPHALDGEVPRGMLDAR